MDSYKTTVEVEQDNAAYLMPVPEVQGNALSVGGNAGEGNGGDFWLAGKTHVPGEFWLYAVAVGAATLVLLAILVTVVYRCVSRSRRTKDSATQSFMMAATSAGEVDSTLCDMTVTDEVPSCSFPQHGSTPVNDNLPEVQILQQFACPV